MKKSMDEQLIDETLELSTKLVKLIEKEIENSDVNKVNLIINSLNWATGCLITQVAPSENDAYKLVKSFDIHLNEMLTSYFTKNEND